MAHFAQLDNNNIVIQVIVVNNNDILDANGIEQESIGVALCRRLCGGADGGGSGTGSGATNGGSGIVILRYRYQ